LKEKTSWGVKTSPVGTSMESPQAEKPKAKVRGIKSKPDRGATNNFRSK